jgi:hypothetical protein
MLWTVCASTANPGLSVVMNLLLPVAVSNTQFYDLIQNDGYHVIASFLNQKSLNFSVKAFLLRTGRDSNPRPPP